MGQTPEDVHEIEKLRHNGKWLKNVMGGEVFAATTTTKLTIAEFSAYIEAVMLDGAEYLGLTFPEPRESEEYREAVRG